MSQTVKERYDDGGFTGSNLDRPALQRLMVDIEAGKVNCIVVYKVDRLSRSLLDFARLMDVLETHGASLVSVHAALEHHAIDGTVDVKYSALVRAI